MALRKILTSEEKALYKHCREVTNFDDRLHTLLDDMRDTLMQADGVGLAAPQVGVLRRAVLVLETNVPEGERPYILELINPEIIESSGEQSSAAAPNRASMTAWTKTSASECPNRPFS